MCVVHRRADGMHTLPDFSYDHNDLARSSGAQRGKKGAVTGMCIYLYVHMTGDINCSKESKKREAETNRGLLF